MGKYVIVEVIPCPVIPGAVEAIDECGEIFCSQNCNDYLVADSAWGPLGYASRAKNLTF